MEGATMLLVVAVKERTKRKKLLPPSMSVVATVRLQNSGTRIEEEERAAPSLHVVSTATGYVAGLMAAGTVLLSPKNYHRFQPLPVSFRSAGVD
ncbi:hypothetical protein PIB30_037424 [Stylosanthes scabra]|uniref:Uncharacterized protein n=1 Tax=Stylosanthes scabra TaxID=79078 RepID=A0ABU6QEE4_9FABA|nr:hypothetical protein [Stylosanthes scabra]